MKLKEKLRGLLRPVFKKRKDILLCKELATESQLKSSRRLEVVPMRPEHLKTLVQFVHEQHSDVARSLRMLDNCFGNRYEGRIAFLDRQVIGYRWWVNSAIHHPQLKLYGISLREDEVFAFGLYIARAFRAQGLAGEFLAISQEQLREQGYKRLYNAVGASNVPARRLYARFGSEELGLKISYTFFSLLTFSSGRWMRYNPVWM